MAEPGLRPLLWGLALLVFGIGDVVTTTVGIRYYGLRETNPLVVRLLGPTPPLLGTVAFKVGVLGVAGIADAIIRRFVGFPGSILVPFFILAVGVWAVQANVANLLIAHRRRGDP